MHADSDGVVPGNALVVRSPETTFWTTVNDYMRVLHVETQSGGPEEAVQTTEQVRQRLPQQVPVLGH